MNIIFRTDSSYDIGTGHLMRCLTLANYLKSSGHKCSFICRNLPGNIMSQVKKSNFYLHELPASAKNNKLNISKSFSYLDWLGVSQEKDADECLSFIKSKKVDIIIVDHYSLDIDWEKLVKNSNYKIFVIDDLANRSHDCNFLLDQSLGRKISDYLCLLPSNTKLMCGPKYSLLREEFRIKRKESLQRRSLFRLKKILINLGGVDKHNITVKVMKALEKSNLPDNFYVCIVAGKKNKNIPNIEKVKNKSRLIIDLKKQTNKMAKLLLDTDLAIGAAGTTSWERCCLGVPSIVIPIAENQNQIAINLMLSNASISIVNSEKGYADMVKIINSFLLDSNKLKSLSEISSSIVDGHGVQRVTNMILK